MYIQNCFFSLIRIILNSYFIIFIKRKIAITNSQLWLYKIVSGQAKTTVQKQNEQSKFMDFNNTDEIKKAGFIGFKKMSELFADSSSIPKIKGVYLVLNPNFKKAEYLQIGTGGHFKGKNPNVLIEELKSNWVENSLVVYIGKAGSETSKATLNSRLKQYFGFGQGKNIGHWGGRLIWQLKNSNDLIVCWKPLLNEDPRTTENTLIKKFVSEFSKRPFANLTD